MSGVTRSSTWALMSVPLTLAAGHQPGALGAGVEHQRCHALGRRAVDQRAQDRLALARVADGERLGLGGEALDEGVGDLLVDDDALGRHADLALVGEGAEGRGVDGLVEIGVVEHDQRRLAAQLQQHGLQVLGARLGDDLADARGAGEVDAPHGRVRDQRVDHGAGVLGRVGHDVDHARREARLAEDAADQPVRARAHLGGLEHHGVAAGERHGDGAHAEDDRRVPRRDAEPPRRPAGG